MSEHNLSRSAAKAEQQIGEQLKHHPHGGLKGDSNLRHFIDKELHGLKSCETAQKFKKDLAHMNADLQKNGLLPGLQIVDDRHGFHLQHLQNGAATHPEHHKSHSVPGVHHHHHHHKGHHAHHHEGHGSHKEFAGGAYKDVKAPDNATLEKSVKLLLAEAKKMNLTPEATRAALAAMLIESKGNPNAVGDHGHSFGLFQLNDRGELKDAMQHGLLKDKTDALDPLKNIDVALSYFKHLEGKYHDPGSLATHAQRPKNWGEYANKVHEYLPYVDSLIKKYGPAP